MLNAIKNISPTELSEKIKADQTQILVDCREQAEWDESHVDGFTLIPLSCFERCTRSFKEQRSRHSHYVSLWKKRSMNACMFLEENGYENLYNVEGGILAWKEAGLETK